MDSLGNEKTISTGGTAQDAPLSAGSVFGQYQIIRLLGRGGMGAVYEVEHTTLGRGYALKLLPADFINSPNALERFKREARVMANLEHPNIIRVDEFGETEGRYWLRMELATGVASVECRVSSDQSSIGNHQSEMLVTLADLAKTQGGKLSQDTLLPILGNILDGLAYAHARGAVHRDLKPSNILLSQNVAEVRSQQSDVSNLPITNNSSLITANFTAKISDFGLVKLVGEEWVKSMVELSVQRSMSLGDEKTVAAGGDPGSAGTSTKSLLGTYEYMSPEQKRGEEADARSDIYSVGLMIYKLLIGRELGMRTPSQIDPSLDKGWDAVVLQALEENPEDRFQSVSELRSQLSGISYQESEKIGHKKAQKDTKKEDSPQKDAELAKAETVGRVTDPAEERWSGRSAHAENAPGRPVSPKIDHANGVKKSGWKWAVAAVVLILVAAGFGFWLYTAQLAENPKVGQASSLSSPSVASTSEASLPQNGPPLATPADDLPPWERAGSNFQLLSTATPEDGYPWMSPSTGMEFVWIDALKMWVGKYEVTNGEYRKKEPGHDSKDYEGHSLNGDRQPVVYVNFDDAVAYAKWLTEQDQKSGNLPDDYEYRLPTGAEWAVFAQCGDGRQYPWGNEWPPKSGQAGNYDDETTFDSNRVEGVYKDGCLVTCNVEASWANPWELYGVGGNVWECTTHDVGGSFDAWAGGSWREASFLDLSALFGRLDGNASYRNYSFGFRLVLSRCSQSNQAAKSDSSVLNGSRSQDALQGKETVGSAMPLNLLTEDFSTTLAGWNVETPSRSSSVKLKDGALEIIGKDGSNYSAEISKDVFPGQVYSEYTLSFDWKVTVRETPNGRTGVRMNFFDRQDNLIGRMEVLDSGQTWRSHIQEHKPSNLSSSQYGGSLRNGKAFDWEHASVSTADIPGLDKSRIYRIQVQAWVHNDAGSGGDLYVDNLQLTATF